MSERRFGSSSPRIRGGRSLPLSGALDLSNLATASVLLPLVPVGVKLGVIIQGRLDEQIFYRISYWALLGIGVKLLFDGSVSLLR